ncbi:hypothetical protein QJS04_geneDACA017917 [Acorus gramineus]|uniref:Uncharacterized protein n=1 Tax=Acorus gramineus TaxID=55184 RepID=A0AAV9AMS6_ACOGR|nr:hypothetical protein QJS04_geneDACA017917 [Acorus gramineus]
MSSYAQLTIPPPSLSLSLSGSMKGLKLSCTSLAATAISTTNDQWSSSTHRGLDRPRDQRRQKTLNPFSNLTHLSPFKPKHHQHKSQNSSSSDQPISPISPPGSTRYLLGDAGMSDAWSDLDEDIEVPKFLPLETTRSHSVKSSASTSSGVRHCEPLVIDRMRFRSIEPEESPVLGVSRYKASFAIDRTRFRSVEPDESPVLKTPTISTSTSRPEKQVFLCVVFILLLY